MRTSINILTGKGYDCHACAHVGHHGQTPVYQAQLGGKTQLPGTANKRTYIYNTHRV